MGNTEQPIISLVVNLWPIASPLWYSKILKYHKDPPLKQRRCVTSLLRMIWVNIWWSISLFDWLSMVTHHHFLTLTLTMSGLQNWPTEFEEEGELSDDVLLLVVTSIELLYKQLAQAPDHQRTKHVKRRTDDMDDKRKKTHFEWSRFSFVYH